jgi:hypothetical protein
MTELIIASQIESSPQTLWLDTVINFFKENNWSFSQHETEPILQMGYQGENGEWMCTAQTREQPRQFIFYSTCTVKAPEKKRLAVAEFLTRANYSLIVGNFEMDFQDGEVRYKTYSIDVENNTLSSALIGQLIYLNVMTMDRYLPGIMSVIYANISPEEAMIQIEG